MTFACKPFGYDEDEGMRIFSIVEMFMSGHHIVTASYVFRQMVENLYPASSSNSININVYGPKVTAFLLTIAVLFMIVLIAQAVSGFLLYLIGWKQRHLIICYIWIILGCTNNLFSIVILLTEVFASSHPIIYWTRFFLYLFYVFYGTWVIIGFITWAKENHIAAGECTCLEKRTGPPVVNRSRARGGTGTTPTAGVHHNNRKSLGVEVIPAPAHKNLSQEGLAQPQIQEVKKKDKDKEAALASGRRGSAASDAKSGFSRASRKR